MMLVNHRYKQEVLQKHKKHERRLGLLIGLELVFRLRVRVRVYEASEGPETVLSTFVLPIFFASAKSNLQNGLLQFITCSLR